MAERDFNLQMTGEQVKDALQQLEDRVAEGWAVGEKDGTPVTSGSPYYENNAKYYAEQAGISAQAAADSAATAEQEVEDGIREGIAGAYVQESATPGAVVTFDDGADNIPLKDLKVNLDIVQPLHGQANPYPAGGGKNKLPFPYYTADGTYNGVTVSTDSVGKITASGTTTAGLFFNLTNGTYSLPAGTYTLSVKGNHTGASIRVRDLATSTSVAIISGGSADASASFTLAEDTATLRIDIAQGATGTAVNFNCTIQLEAGSTATDYAPYSNICPIYPVTEAEVYRNGVNQWDEEWEAGGIDDTTGEPISASTQFRSKNFISAKPETDYYVKSGGSIYLYCYNTNFAFIGRILIGGAGNLQNKVATTLAATAYIKFKCQPGGINPSYSNNISINYPSTDTAYHSGAGNAQYVVDFGENVVYGGELDVTTGVLTATQAKRILNGTETWYAYTSYEGFRITLTDMVVGTFSAGRASWLKTASGILDMDTAFTVRFGSSSGNDMYVCHTYAVADTVEEWTAYLASNPLEIVYPLATPISIQLDPTEVDTLRGDNVIWADCGDITNCEYRADLKMYIDKVVGA